MFEITNGTIELRNVVIKLWVFNGVVPKVEPFAHMNSATKPSGEVGVVYLADFLTVFIDHQFLQIVVVNILFVRKVLQHVFNSDESVVVAIKNQECLPNRLEATAELDLEQLVELLNSALHYLSLFLFVIFELLLFLNNFSVFIRLRLFLNDVQMRVEVLFESVEGHGVRRQLHLARVARGRRK